MLAATNKDLQAEIRAGQFREDLYFRLNVIPIFVPPLRERAGGHPAARRSLHGGVRARVRPPAEAASTPGALAVLQRYAWPGNVRELRNVIERLMIMVPGDAITARRPRASSDRDQRPTRRAAPAARTPLLPLHEARDGSSATHPARRWREQQGNMSRTADVLGVERSNLYRKMRAFGIAPVRRRAELRNEDGI